MVKIVDIEYVISDPRPERRGRRTTVGAKVDAPTMIDTIQFVEAYHRYSFAEVTEAKVAKEFRRNDFDYDDTTPRFV